MKRGVLLALLLSGCAQQAPRPADIHDPTALRYLNEHGARVEVQVPATGWVDASLMIDPKQAEKARETNHSLAHSATSGGGALGLLLASAINTQIGSAALEREAEHDAKQAAQNMAVVLDDHPYNGRLQQRYNEASNNAGLRPSTGAISARLVINPQVMISPDRGSFVLVSQVELQDLGGSLLYRARIEVQSLSFRRCGEHCVDDGGLEPEKINAVLEGCIDESMRVLAADLNPVPGSPAREQTVRYLLDGRRVVERGRLLPSSDQYTRYRNLEGALKAVPVAMLQAAQ
ncbi:hypothetical protein [Pseudomonas fontis]|uniref:Lipoprotein n=1 Tax=Pseudomonas fontis TaxID=2942633 RepID=A0ABT5NZZ7_9PSED|nr:hypothetical protein [Pseudomonas fontis]MDD0977090.1 hypothetical protein [Pseudomonas fontis]MDD0993774.1 hypothetical protein [Pseudomonas fontis]